MSGTPWNIEGIELVTCNCDYGCPCQFNALPTHGDCRAAIGYRIDKGSWGQTSLDGLSAIIMYAWPKAIHEGHGEGQLIVDEGASEAQREALRAIFYGEDGTEPVVAPAVFATTIERFHDPLVGKIDSAIDERGRTGHFIVDGVIEVRGEPIKNPVTGQAHEARVTLPHGFEYHSADYASGRTSTTGSAFPLSWQNAHAHFARIRWTNTGIAHA